MQNLWDTLPLAASFLQFKLYDKHIIFFLQPNSPNSIPIIFFYFQKLQYRYKYYNSALLSRNFTENNTILFALKLAIVVISTFRGGIVVRSETVMNSVSFSPRSNCKRIELTFKLVELVGSNATRPRRTLLSSAYVFVRDANPPICIGLR